MRARLIAVLAALALTALTACQSGSEAPGPSATPERGACRNLQPTDLTLPSNDTATVDCDLPHTAETFLVGTFPASLDGQDPDRPELGKYVHDICQPSFLTFTGADESLGLRTLLTWVWFRPAANAWKDGARWFRCDVVGGGADSPQLLALPSTTSDLLKGQPDDKWMACASGPNVDKAEKVPCSEDHNWRAVSTVVLGSAEDPFPGSTKVEALSSKYCEDSVSAWLGYPKQFDYGFTWFGKSQWDAGNRRSVCWAKTSL